MLHQVKELVCKDIRLNVRDRNALYSMLLYVLSTSYVAYLSFGGVIDSNSWVALFWIIVLFAAMNACLQSFKKELKDQSLFYYIIANPRAIILAKTFFNSGLLIFLTLTSYFIYCLFLGNPITANISFILCMILGSSAIASVLTLVSAIASKTNNNAGLMAVLSMPLLFPLLLNLIQTTKICLSQNNLFIAGNQLLFLALLNIASVLLSYLLFPYLWRD